MEWSVEDHLRKAAQELSHKACDSAQRITELSSLILYRQKGRYSVSADAASDSAQARNCFIDAAVPLRLCSVVAELEGDGVPEGLICGLLDFLLLCMERLVKRHAAVQAPDRKQTSSH